MFCALSCWSSYCLPLVPGSVAFVATGMTLSGVAMAGIALIFVAAHLHTIVEASFAKLVSKMRPQLAQALQQHLHDFLASVRVIQGRRLWLCLLWSVITWTVSVASMYVLMLAFDPHPKWFIGMLANCGIALGVALPSAPSGLGLWEAATVAHSPWRLCLPRWRWRLQFCRTSPALFHWQSLASPGL